MIGYRSKDIAWFDQQTGSAFKKNGNITSSTISSTAITTTILTRKEIQNNMTIANLFFFFIIFFYFFEIDQFAEVDSFNLVAGDLEIALDSGQT